MYGVSLISIILSDSKYIHLRMNLIVFLVQEQNKGRGHQVFASNTKMHTPRSQIKKGPSWLECLTDMILSCFLGIDKIYLNTFRLSHCLARLYRIFSFSPAQTVIFLVMFIFYLIDYFSFCCFLLHKTNILSVNIYLNTFCLSI